MKEEYQRQLKALPEGRLTVARKGTGAYYSKFQSGTKTYLGTAANEEVKSLQQRRILEASIQRIDSNLKLMDQYVRQYQPVDRMSVLQTLPKADVYKRQEQGKAFKGLPEPGLPPGDS